jgi:hypothetical protein
MGAVNSADDYALEGGVVYEEAEEAEEAAEEAPDEVVGDNPYPMPHGVPLFLAGTDTRLAFKSDGTRHDFCKYVLPRPMNAEERAEAEKRKAEKKRMIRKWARRNYAGDDWSIDAADADDATWD